MKAWLSQKQIPFTEKNVREDQAALDELKRMGFNSVPVTVINGQRIVGFDQEQLAKALAS
ncbi:MAG: glutaredoxin family protein [Candidatus Methylomirabilis oxyfera]|nr:glutaredoxin family protein [Candidatus Methylomirabilis oxyfera]